jgi:hypothetical protein
MAEWHLLKEIVNASQQLAMEAHGIITNNICDFFVIPWLFIGVRS